MSFTTWTPLALLSSARQWRGSVWRIVDAQYTAGTMKLVDTREEQDILDGLLDSQQRTLPEAFRQLDPLLAAPFRANTLRTGSRFRAVTDPGVFYGAIKVDTACAEQGYWRWKFLQDAPELPDIKPVAHTAFEADIATLAIDLREAPFARDAAQWNHKTSYSATQALAWSARAANLGAVRYASVRDPERGECVAVLTPAAFSAAIPHPVRQTWWLRVRRTEVLWRSEQRSLVFSSEGWQ